MDQKAGKNLLEASQNIVRLTNENRASNVLLQQCQSGQPLTEGQKQELAGLLNQYGYELQSMDGYTPQQAADAIQSVVAGKAFVASTGDTKAYNEALSYLKGYSVQSGQATIGTDALPGAPGIIARSTLAASGGLSTGSRSTVPNNEMKIISVGSIRPNQVKNLIEKGSFVPLP